MKQIIRIYSLVLLVVFLASCSKFVKKTIEDNPDIVFSAIKNNPVGFMEAVRTAAQEAQKKEIVAAQEAEKKGRDEEFKNPKQPKTEGRAVLGEDSAPITIVEYSDFQCPFCQKGAATVERLMDEYKGKIKLLFKHLPLEDKHPNARLGSQYFEAIAMQDVVKAYEFKKLIFKNQSETYGDAGKLYKKLAKKAGANMAKLTSDMKNKASELDKIIDEDKKEAGEFGFNGTPGYLINGVSLKGAYPIDGFKKIIDRHLKGQ